jgi:glycosyltransferase involved in cell wall biosynthesis
MKNPLVSIITIVYNNGEGIERTINSVLSQTYSTIEYIIIDGGSIDNTLSVVKKYQENISYWISEKDKGISDAFNKGIKQAKGDIIGLINSGDYYEDNAVELIVKEYCKSNPKEDQYYVLHGKIRMFRKGFSKTYPALKLESFSYQMPIWHPTVFTNKKVYQDFSYCLNYKVAMDYELFSRVFYAQGTFIYLDSLISSMNIDGISNTHASKGFKEVMLASRKNLKIDKLRSFFYFQYRMALNKFIFLVKKNA